MKPHRSRLFLFAFFIFSVLLLEIITPKFIQTYIDIIQEPEKPLSLLMKLLTNLFPKEIALLTIFATLYIIFSLLLYSLRIITMWISQKLAWSATNQLRYDLTEHCMNLDMTFHNQMKPGELIERIDGDVANLANFFSQFSVDLLASTLLIIGVVIVLFFEHWIIGLTFTGFILLSFLLVGLMRNIAVPKWEKVREAEANIFGYIEEAISGKEEIRANGLKPNIMKNYYDYSRSFYISQVKAVSFGRFFRALVFGLTAFSIMLVFITGIPLYQNNKISFGALFAIFIYTSIIRNMIFRIIQQIQNFQQFSACTKRIQELFTIKTKISNSGINDFPENLVSLQFKNVSFYYNQDEQVLSLLNFQLTPNQSLGIIGHTGCGKTTISRLIFRLYEQQQGCICINGIDHREINLHELRKNVAYVTQNIELFQASIRDNITFFDDSISDEQILNVLEQLHLTEWIQSMPKGLDSKLKTGELGLSAGEAQLLALTRVFMKDPRIVILDEASSRLDPATEELLNYAVHQLIQGRIAIIIAHRLSTIKKVDDILILTKGNVLEYGSQEDLLRNTNSIYNQYLIKGLEEIMT